MGREWIRASGRESRESAGRLVLDLEESQGVTAGRRVASGW